MLKRRQTIGLKMYRQNTSTEIDNEVKQYEHKIAKLFHEYRKGREQDHDHCKKTKEQKKALHTFKRTTTQMLKIIKE